MKTPMCEHCGVRRAQEAEDRFDVAEGRDKRCDICNEAHRLAFTSVDDARQAIKAETNVDVLYMIAAYDLARKEPRSSLLSMVRSRLSKLIGIRGLQLPGEKPN